MADLDWATGAWLVLEAVRKYDSKTNSFPIKGVKVVKVVQKYPSFLAKDEIAVKFEVVVPAVAFEPHFTAVLKITEDMVGEQVLQAQVL